MMSPYLSCSNQHAEVRWHWLGAGYSCWYCGALGKPSTGPTITATTPHFDDPDPHGSLYGGDAA